MAKTTAKDISFEYYNIRSEIKTIDFDFLIRWVDRTNEIRWFTPILHQMKKQWWNMMNCDEY